MELKAAKELLHIQAWLTRVDEIVRLGQAAYLSDDLLHESGRAGTSGDELRAAWTSFER